MLNTDFTTLPFVSSENGKATSLWAVEPSGNWSADNATGRSFANALIDYIRASDDAGIMARVAKAIGEAGQQDGVQVGFWTGLATSYPAHAY